MKMLRCLLPLFAVPLAAQGLLIQSTPQPGVTPGSGHRPQGANGVAITRTQVQAEIVDGVASTTIEQVIANGGGRDAEAIWFMPLPNGAVADAFVMTVGGKEIAGEVLDAGQARTVYEGIVRRRRDPGLLEYAGEGLLRARIFPIPAQGEVAVTVRLRQVLQPTGGLYEWSFPVRAASLGDVAAGPIGVQVKIRSRTALSTIVTPSGSAEIRRDGDHAAAVGFEAQPGEGEDLRVLYGLTQQEFGLHLLPFRMADEPGWFTMLLSPPRTLADAKVAPRCVQFVVDTSGSMKGDKIEQAKASLRAFLQSLRPEDRFQIVTFASSVQPFFEAPRPANPENIATATGRIDALQAMGGTNIGEALQQALSVVPATADDGTVLLPQIVFVTDGQATVGLTRPDEILALTKQSDRSATRIFALGVGDQIDVRLIDDLVQQHRGARDFVGNKEKIETKVDALCQKISRPALTDVEVRCDGLDSFDVHPTRTRDLFCGEMMQVVGRYRDSGVHRVVVRGMQNGQAKEFVFDVDFPKLAAAYPFVQTLWARQHIATLLDAIRRNGQQPELVAEVRSLATRYGIVTPFTSQLIVEEGMRLSGGVPVQPAGDRWGALDGGSGPAVPRAGGGGGRGGRGPAGPTTGGPTGPGAPGASADPGTLALLGRTRTGQAAIEESKAVSGSDDFYLGGTRRTAPSREAGETTPAKNVELVRHAAGRAFVQVGDDLVEQGLPDDWAKQAILVEAFSVDYFALLKAKPTLQAVLALGARVAFRDGERIVHVKPGEAPQSGEGVEPAAGEQPAKETPTSQPVER